MMLDFTQHKYPIDSIECLAALAGISVFAGGLLLGVPPGCLALGTLVTVVVPVVIVRGHECYLRTRKRPNET